MDFSKSYLIKITAITSVILIFVAGFNLFIDPFNVFNSPVIHNINQQKPEFQTHVRMTKAHQVRLQKPELIILGSSRAESGINPNHPGFSVAQNKRYNLALHSANIYEVLRYLQHAQSIQPLKQVVIGLDFFMFNVNKQNEVDFNETRLAPAKTGWFKDIFQALLTYDGLIASIDTITTQRVKDNIQYFSNGFRNDNHNWTRIQKSGGHYQAATKNERYTFYALDEFTFFALSKQSQASQSMNAFLEILIFCKANKIDLRLFISPIHARKLEIFHQIKLWNEFENWKKHLIQLIETNTPEYSLWDFTGYNEITTEPFPPLGDTKTQMQWYWESSHYKKETGDLILDIILNYTSDDRKAPPQFGIKLTTQNIEQHLFNQRAVSKKFATNYPKIVAEINKMIINTIPKREKLIQQHPDLVPLNHFKQLSTNTQIGTVH